MALDLQASWDLSKVTEQAGLAVAFRNKYEAAIGWGVGFVGGLVCSFITFHNFCVDLLTFYILDSFVRKAIKLVWKVHLST